MAKNSPKPTLEYEKALWDQGVFDVIGIDEVGRGSWAGPVVAAAVIFDEDVATKLIQEELSDVKDSKLLSQAKREALSKIILSTCKRCYISEVSVEDINQSGVGESAQKAFIIALEKVLGNKRAHVLIDAFYIKEVPKNVQTPIIKGDQKSFSIAAASIIAKVYRDNLMVKLGEGYRQYGFEINKGYGTKSHQLAISKHGLCKIHRTSFNLSSLLNKELSQIAPK